MKILIIAAFLLIGISNIKAQTRSTKATKVILVVNKKSNSAINLELFIDKYTEDKLVKKYPNSNFYIGMLKGDFELIEGTIEPKTGAVITLYTDKQLFTNKSFFPNENIMIGKMRTKTVSNKKGEIIVKII